MRYRAWWEKRVAKQWNGLSIFQSLNFVIFAVNVKMFRFTTLSYRMRYYLTTRAVATILITQAKRYFQIVCFVI